LKQLKGRVSYIDAKDTCAIDYKSMRTFADKNS